MNDGFKWTIFINKIVQNLIPRLNLIPVYKDFIYIYEKHEAKSKYVNLFYYVMK